MLQFKACHNDNTEQATVNGIFKDEMLHIRKIEALINKDPSSVEEFMEFLRSNNWNIITREQVDSAIERVYERLDKYYEDDELWTEFYISLHKEALKCLNTAMFMADRDMIEDALFSIEHIEKKFFSDEPSEVLRELLESM
jgi:hypothetical protein